jgi:hypothetical protein
LVSRSQYEVIASDSKDAGKANTNDQVVVFYASPDGQQITEIVPSSERVISVMQVSDAEFLIVYTTQKSTAGTTLKGCGAIWGVNPIVRLRVGHLGIRRWDAAGKWQTKSLQPPYEV